MVKRKTTFKKKYGGQNRWKIYGKATKQLAADAYKGVQLVKQLVNTEFDYKDTAATVNPAAAGALVLLNGLTQGDTASSRTGNSIRMKSYDMRWFVNNNSSAGQTEVRVMLVLDKQSNGVTPSVTDILATNTVVSPRNLDNRKRFKVIMDRNYAISTAGPSSRYDSAHFKNIQTHVAYYNSSNAGTVADISTNALYLLYLSDQATNTPGLQYYFRLRFIDN